MRSHDTRRPTGGGPLVERIGRLAGVAFTGLARARRSKPVHPKGAVYEGVLRLNGSPHVPAAAELLATPAEHPALVRFSRSLGLPPPLPDLFGIAIRLTDVHGAGEHQDFLAVTSVDAPIFHHLFVPVIDPQSAPYSSALPYGTAGERFIIGVEPLPDSPRPAGRSLDERLDRAAATAKLRFAFSIAPLSGRFKAVGELRIGDRLPDEANALRFNPWNTGGGLEPVGVLNRLRAYAYPASQEGWVEEPSSG